MQLRESLTVAVDALRANKLRAVLTSIGVIIGSASIVLVVTVALTSQKFVISQIEAIGSNLVWVELVKTPEKTQPLSYELTVADMEAIKANIPRDRRRHGIFRCSYERSGSRSGAPGPVNWVTQNYQKIRKLIMMRGRYFRQWRSRNRSQGLPDYERSCRSSLWRGKSCGPPDPYG